jgi:hypothetical protein
MVVATDHGIRFRKVFQCGRPREEGRDSAGAPNPSASVSLAKSTCCARLLGFLFNSGAGVVSSGYAFVHMETVDDAQRCVDRLNNAVLDGRSLLVEFARRTQAYERTPGECTYDSPVAW